MPRTNETRFIKWHEKCKCECRLDAIVCNNKQRWNKNKCGCECKELIDKGICEYLDYGNCKCRKKSVDKLIDECTETIEEVKLANLTIFENENNYKYSSCKRSSWRVYIVLMIAVLTNFTGITIYFVYYICSLIKNNISCSKFNTRKEIKIWWMKFHWMNIEMGEIKKINIKNRSYYFYNDIIDFDEFDGSKIKID